MALVRSLNGAGIARFRDYLAQLRRGSVGAPPAAILDDLAFTTELSESIEVEQRSFSDRRVVGRHLCDCLSPLEAGLVNRSAGLWAWLSLFWFDQVCPARADGSRRPGRDYRHIPDFGYRYRTRHLLLGPYQVYKRHGARALVLLSGPVDSESSLYHEITSRQELLANRSVVDAALLLYIDPSTGLPKRGAQDPKSGPGTVRRFVRVLQQLDLTYDIYGMSGRELLGLLPEEFNPWRPVGLELE